MAARFRPNPNMEGDLSRSPELRALLRNRGEDAGREAVRIARQISDTYETTVSDEGPGVRVSATTRGERGVNAASYIEFGTGHPGPTPAYAPLRKGVEAAGLKTRAR